MDFNYATMGSSLIPMNPLAGGIATGVGLGVDLLMNRQNQMSQLQATRDYNKKMMEVQPSIYEQPGGYKQVMPGLKKGGAVKSQKGIAFRNRKPAGHIIPADKVPEAQADAREAGVNLKRIPGQGSPTADDRMLQLPGAEPVRVSSGEALVSDDEFGDMARMAGMDRVSYQMKMYPNSPHMGSSGMADGGQIPPTNPPKLTWEQQKQAYADSLVMHDFVKENNQIFDQFSNYLNKSPGPQLNFQHAHGQMDMLMRDPDGQKSQAFDRLTKLNGEKPLKQYWDENAPVDKGKNRGSTTLNGSEPLQRYQDFPKPKNPGVQPNVIKRMFQAEPARQEVQPMYMAKGGPIKSMADGGQLDWNPPGAPSINNMNMPSAYGQQMAVLRQFGQGQTPGLPTMASAPRTPGINGMGPMAIPGTLPPAPAPAAPSIGYGDGETNEPPPVKAQGGGTDPAKQPGAFDMSQPTADLGAEDPGAEKSITQAGMDDGSIEKGFEDMQQANDQAAYGQAIPALLSMGHNLFSRRVAGRPPMAYQPMMLDMHTEAMSAGLNAGRQRSVATAAQNSRGEQSQSRNLGIGANDQAARTSNNMAVEGVKNQERQINTQTSNQAAQFNAQRNDQFEAGEAAGTNDWKLRKGQAITNDLAALSGIVGGHAQGNVDIGAMKQMFGFQKRLYDTMSGAPSSQYATPSYVFTGDKKDMAQPEQTADSLMDPMALQAMLSSSWWGGGKYKPSFNSLTNWRTK